MKKLNKLFLAAGSVAAIAAPVAAVVSCGTTESNGSFAVGSYTSRTAVENPKAKIDNVDAYQALDGHNHSVTDNSFNQQAYEGAVEWTRTESTNTTVHVLTPQDPDGISEFHTAYNNTPDSANTVLIAPGFSHIAPISSYDLGNRGAILLDGDIAKPNIASVVFNVHQAAFLAGVATGEYLNAKKDVYGTDGHLKAGTFGGLNFDTVTGFMAGFQAGIKYFNAHLTNGQQKVEFIDLGGKNDYFSGGFSAGGGTVIANKLINAGADVILPVAGPQTQDVLTAISNNKKSIGVIGVDSAQEKIYSDKNLLFSITKDLKKATIDELTAIKSGASADAGFGKLLVGTLANKLVGISNSEGAKTGVNNDVKTVVEAVYNNQDVIAAAGTFSPEFFY